MQTVDLHPLDPAQKYLHGKRLSVTIKGKLVNVSALADMLGIDQSYLSKILSGKLTPNKDTFRKIAIALDMSPGQLFDAIELRSL